MAGPRIRPAGAARDRGTEGSGRLVTVFLRGGMDHLSAVFPLDDARYHDARPSIGVDGPELAAGFGLHPVMPRLRELHEDGRFVPVVATGNPAGNRSHFTAMDLAATGRADVGGAHDQGWLARHLLGGRDAGDPGEDSPLRAVTVGDTVDRSLSGYPAPAMASIGTFGLGGRGEAWELTRLLGATHRGTTMADAIGRQALGAADAVSALSGSDAADMTRRSFDDAATLLTEGGDAGLGTEIVTLDIGGWDTHDNIGTADEGPMRELLGGLDETLGRFVTDLADSGADDVHVVVQTEFGRRVVENGSGGTDHGWGSLILVFGPDLAAGTVAGDWPGLSPDVLGERGDIPVTTDFRDVLAEVAGHALGADPATCFPDHEARPVGLFRT